MKTTVEISDPLARDIRDLAARQHTTLRALIEAGLRAVLQEQSRAGTFRLRDASFAGNGLQPEFRDGGWERVRRAVYEGRGG